MFARIFIHHSVNKASEQVIVGLNYVICAYILTYKYACYKHIEVESFCKLLHLKPKLLLTNNLFLATLIT